MVKTEEEYKKDLKDKGEKKGKEDKGKKEEEKANMGKKRDEEGDDDAEGKKRRKTEGGPGIRRKDIEEQVPRQIMRL